jgi:hypothetical protein
LSVIRFPTWESVYQQRSDHGRGLCITCRTRRYAGTLAFIDHSGVERSNPHTVQFSKTTCPWALGARNRCSVCCSDALLLCPADEGGNPV